MLHWCLLRLPKALAFLFLPVYGIPETPPLQLKGRFKRGPFCLQKWTSCKQLLSSRDLGYRTFMRHCLKKKLSFKCPSSKPPF